MVQPLIVPVKNSACTKYMSVPTELNLHESFDVFIRNYRSRASTLQICLEKTLQNEYAMVIGHRNDIVVRTGEETCVSAEIRGGAVQSLVPRKFA